MNLGSRIIFSQLFQQHGQVRIPIIQRDYAQGRPAAEEVREEFLGALEEALRKPADDPTLPLNLDFVYGSVEGVSETRFLPLDGQQRLTTLFLLHWYLAWADDEWNEFERLFQSSQGSRFAYSVRPSSTEFFDKFVDFRPVDRPDGIPQLRVLISDQPWYFRSWRLDPTVQSVLGMLDAIHKRFVSATGLFQRLTNESLPAITFQLLDLRDFGLSDDLYIKMNARGKPLTEFENFKARYGQELEQQFEGVAFSIDGQCLPVDQYVALRMDTAWTDLIWRLWDKKSNLYDGALLNIFRAVTLVTRNPNGPEYLNDVGLLREGWKVPSFSDFLSHKWLDEDFTLGIIHLLEAWSLQPGKLSTLLPNVRYFDERAFFDKITANGGNILYVEVVQFAAYLGFISEHQGAIDAAAFQEWMRIACTLSEYTVYNRADDLRRSIIGLRGMLEHSKDILQHFAKSDDPASGFNLQQIAEEKLKAELILAEPRWRNLIDRAEVHGYFHGQIEFLLDFSGVRAAREDTAPGSWHRDIHLALQDSFLNYLQIAEQMFTSDGLQSLSKYQWQRALLSIGNYMLPQGRNSSFLVDSKDNLASWKRLLRGTGEYVPAARKTLHRLWETLDPNRSIPPQLESVITKATSVPPWRAALVRTPKAIAYCQNQSLRMDSDSEIYLLAKTRMSGAHAELFTYCLYQNVLVGLKETGHLRPLKLAEYFAPSGTDVEPMIWLEFRYNDHDATFGIKFQGGQYRLFIFRHSLESWPELLAWLISFGFSETESMVTKLSSSEDIETLIGDLAGGLAAAFPNPNLMP